MSIDSFILLHETEAGTACKRGFSQVPLHEREAGTVCEKGLFGLYERTNLTLSQNRNCSFFARNTNVFAEWETLKYAENTSISISSP